MLLYLKMFHLDSFDLIFVHFSNLTYNMKIIKNREYTFENNYPNNQNYN